MEAILALPGLISIVLGVLVVAYMVRRLRQGDRQLEELQAIRRALEGTGQKPGNPVERDALR